MNTFKIILNYNFISSIVRLTWNDILYGIETGFFSDEIAIKHAIAEIVEEDNPSDIVMEIASLFDGESIHPFIDELASKEIKQNDLMKEKLLYVLLKLLFENRGQHIDPFGIIEQIYADFDYPESISKFVRYMPVEEGNSSVGENYLLDHWKKYLENQQQRFSQND